MPPSGTPKSARGLVTIHLSLCWPGFAVGCTPNDNDMVEVVQACLL